MGAAGLISPLFTLLAGVARARFCRGVCEELRKSCSSRAFLQPELSPSPGDGGASPGQCGRSEVGELDAEGGIHFRIKGYK